MNPEKIPCVYMLANKRNGTLYIGVTSDLTKRVWQHKNDLGVGFAMQHGAHLLVWYEIHPTMESAIVREKRMKGWHRNWKIRLIEETNYDWVDLYPQIL